MERVFWVGLPLQSDLPSLLGPGIGLASHCWANIRITSCIFESLNTEIKIFNQDVLPSLLIIKNYCTLVFQSCILLLKELQPILFSFLFSLFSILYSHITSHISLCSYYWDNPEVWKPTNLLSFLYKYEAAAWSVKSDYSSAYISHNAALAKSANL